MKKFKSYLCFLLITVFSFNAVIGSNFSNFVPAKSVEGKLSVAADDLSLPQFNFIADDQDETAEFSDLKKLSPATFVNLTFHFPTIITNHFPKTSFPKIFPVPLFIINSAFII